MSTITLQKVLDVLNDSAGISDPRMDRFLMKSPLQVATIVSLYLATIYKFGPSFMKHRKPYSLRGVMISYNLFQIAANTALFFLVLPRIKHMSLLCTPYETTNSEENLQHIRIHYLYTLLKYFDLIETVFYVLWKKERQISFLHVYHHVGILLSAWVAGKYFPGGQAIYVGLYNTPIHAIMYCYYLMTSWSPGNTTVMSWKSCLTVLQIVQHCCIFLSVFPAVVNWNCWYPKVWMAIFSFNVLIIIHLFGQFYRNTYMKKKE